jgi:mannose-6-phosphate isomerase-like protein (cupin superfamily)
LHPHNADEEIYYILKGNALFHDDGIDKELKPGDVTITGGGATHSIEAVGSEPLELIAIVAG